MSDDTLHLDEADSRVDRILRSMTIDDLEFEAPPADVWAGIEAEFARTAPVAPVISLASRRRPALLAAAVAAALVLVAGLAVVFTGDDGPVELAAAELSYIPNDDGFIDEGIGRTATVTLVEDGDRELVRFDAADLPTVGEGNDLEAWVIGVIGGEIQVVQPIGLVEDPSAPGTFTIPADFDRSAYDAVAVDISLEPHDGDPDHSGMSLVRGPLVEL
ncbi:MAG: anti-sigma factor [Acidimicrobiales bacterium]|nr:anti-sigma factor [Acidimicrobiales bacterium]